MQRFQCVDIIDSLRRIMNTNTKHYRADFIIDADHIKEAFASKDEQDKYLFFMSRPEGTWCFNEANVFMKDTSAHNTWTHYADTNDNILAYAVLVRDIEDGIITGSVYELDYKNHCELVKGLAVQASNKRCIYERGEEILPYDKPITQNHISYGKLKKVVPVPDEPNKLNSVLSAQHDRYSHLKAGNIEEHISELHRADVKRQLADMSEEEKDYFIESVGLAIDYGMTENFTEKDIELYHAIDEERSAQKAKEKPSIRKQLADFKGQKEKKQPDHEKNKEDISL